VNSRTLRARDTICAETMVCEKDFKPSADMNVFEGAEMTLHESVTVVMAEINKVTSH
jgi:hypothetical protein